ncbi:GNAT family N-acetyltransferase [Lacticaseibacillus porcinae]|uniref:GNAT family N-acetyltransferase n=1 Tax=Lacticaseibacillus porcinae TaxID=1123687 RepID=UPI000F78C58A|nr:GNAT family N-acetyltransferase [Lacticaseibacillus porcinae]
MIQFRQAQRDDLDAIMVIEHAGFTLDEAATQEAMQARIANYPDTFIVAVEAGQLLGYIVGPAIDQRYLADDLFVDARPNAADANFQSVLSLAVAPVAQHRGLGSQLLTQLRSVATNQRRQAITLTCLKRLVPFYEANGYVNEGVSESSHAGEVWYNLVLSL